jgi:hypothetical protein
MKNRIFPYIIAFSALSVSLSAAFYSVTGLSKLFAGASFEVLIMASSLEVSKLVIASLLYQYWTRLNKVLRVYLTIACSVLILITSAGIYGFLSSAYQETANLAGNVDKQIELLEKKRDNYSEQVAVFNSEKESINTSINNLRAGLSNNTSQRVDHQTGQLIITSSSSNRRALEKQLDQAISRQSVINAKVDSLNVLIFDIETQIVDVESNGELASELGPLKYLSNLTGISMDKIINYLLLIIIFVFDPLAIALVIAANFAFTQLKPNVPAVVDEPIATDITTKPFSLTDDNIDDTEPDSDLTTADEEPTDEPDPEYMESLNPDDLAWLQLQVKNDEDKKAKIKKERNSYWT